MIIQSSKSSDFSLSLTSHSQSISHPFGSILKMYLISNYFSLLPTSPLLPSEPPSSVTASQLILLLPLCLRFSKQKARVILIQQDHITLLLCSRPINCFSLVQNKMAYKVHNWPQEPLMLHLLPLSPLLSPWSHRSLWCSSRMWTHSCQGLCTYSSRSTEGTRHHHHHLLQVFKQVSLSQRGLL